jgi:hypothetical protein
MRSLLIAVNGGGLPPSWPGSAEGTGNGGFPHHGLGGAIKLCHLALAFVVQLRLHVRAEVAGVLHDGRADGCALIAVSL